MNSNSGSSSSASDEGSTLKLTDLVAAATSRHIHGADDGMQKTWPPTADQNIRIATISSPTALAALRSVEAGGMVLSGGITSAQGTAYFRFAKPTSLADDAIPFLHMSPKENSIPTFKLWVPPGLVPDAPPPTQPPTLPDDVVGLYLCSSGVTDGRDDTKVQWFCAEYSATAPAKDLIRYVRAYSAVPPGAGGKDDPKKKTPVDAEKKKKKTNEDTGKPSSDENVCAHKWSHSALCLKGKCPIGMCLLCLVDAPDGTVLPGTVKSGCVCKSSDENAPRLRAPSTAVLIAAAAAAATAAAGGAATSTRPPSFVAAARVGPAAAGAGASAAATAVCAVPSVLTAVGDGDGASDPTAGSAGGVKGGVGPAAAGAGASAAATDTVVAVPSVHDAVGDGDGASAGGAGGVEGANASRASGPKRRRMGPATVHEVTDVADPGGDADAEPLLRMTDGGYTAWPEDDLPIRPLAPAPSTPPIPEGYRHPEPAFFHIPLEYTRRLSEKLVLNNHPRDNRALEPDDASRPLTTVTMSRPLTEAERTSLMKVSTGIIEHAYPEMKSLATGSYDYESRLVLWVNEGEGAAHVDTRRSRWCEARHPQVDLRRRQKGYS